MGNRFGVCLVLFVALNPRVHAASVPDPNQVQPDSATTFTFAPGQWPLFVPVRLGPRTYDFILDTGSTGTMFDSSFRAQLGASKGKHRAFTPSRKAVAVELFAAPHAFVGPFSLADCNEVACASLDGLAPRLGRKADGILGMNFLKKHVIQIDFDEGRLAFLDREQGDRQDWGQELPITYNPMRLPQIKLAIGDQAQQDFVVDTGCDMSGGIVEDSFRLAVAQAGLKPVDTAMVTFAGVVVKSKQVRTGRATAGPFEYPGLILTRAKGNLLGVDFLSRHVVTFDFPHDRLYLKKGKSFDKPDEAGMCGVSLDRSDGRTVVSAIYKGQPAAKAGIKAGDTILKLDGRDVSTYEMWEIRDLMRSGHGKEITITIQRGDKIKDMKVILERQV